jgi:hypothetical protein
MNELIELGYIVELTQGSGGGLFLECNLISTFTADSCHVPTKRGGGVNVIASSRAICSSWGGDSRLVPPARAFE